MTHSLLAEHMALDPFENLLKEVGTAVQRACTARLQRVADEPLQPPRGGVCWCATGERGDGDPPVQRPHHLAHHCGADQRRHPELLLQLHHRAVRSAAARDADLAALTPARRIEEEAEAEAAVHPQVCAHARAADRPGAAQPRPQAGGRLHVWQQGACSANTRARAIRWLTKPWLAPDRRCACGPNPGAQPGVQRHLRRALPLHWRGPLPDDAAHPGPAVPARAPGRAGQQLLPAGASVWPPRQHKVLGSADGETSGCQRHAGAGQLKTGTSMYIAAVMRGMPVKTDLPLMSYGFEGAGPVRRCRQAHATGAHVADGVLCAARRPCAQPRSASSPCSCSRCCSTRTSRRRRSKRSASLATASPSPLSSTKCSYVAAQGALARAEICCRWRAHARAGASGCRARATRSATRT